MRSLRSARRLRHIVVATSLLLTLVTACGRGDAAETHSATKLAIGDPDGQLAVTLATPADTLGFEPEWANLSGGAEVSQAWRARALDVGSVGGIPPIQANATDLPVKIIALRYRVNPAYALGVAPNGGIKTVNDLKGKKLAYSSGQESGLFILKLLKSAGLTASDVQLVNLTSDKYLNAVSSNQIDAAPFAEPNLTRYLDNFAAEGAIALHPAIESTPTTLTAPVEVLNDPAKFEALKLYVLAWQRGFAWADQHPDEWIQKFYVEQEGVDAESGKRIVESIGPPLFPRNFDHAKNIEEQALALLVEEGVIEAGSVDVNDLFDARFDGLVDESIDDNYIESES